MSYFMVEEQLIKVWQAEALEEAHDKQPGTIISADKKVYALPQEMAY